MKVTVRCPKEIDLKPGYTVRLRSGGDVIINRIVETRYHIYVVLSNGTWRPLSSYGKTWALHPQYRL